MRAKIVEAVFLGGLDLDDLAVVDLDLDVTEPDGAGGFADNGDPLRGRRRIEYGRLGHGKGEDWRGSASTQDLPHTARTRR